VAYKIESRTADALRAGLAAGWNPWLTPQDRQTLRLHVTIQNKVAPATARGLIEALEADFTPFSIAAEALRLWSYEGGPWTLLDRFPFEA
ncbi:MAG: 2'-5' RNA ligase family protein, partial [Microvirga sp.]